MGRDLVSDLTVRREPFPDTSAVTCMSLHSVEKYTLEKETTRMWLSEPSSYLGCCQRKVRFSTLYPSVIQTGKAVTEQPPLAGVARIMEDIP